MAKAANTNDPAVLSAFDAMIAGVAGVERKGAAMPYASVNGNMFAMVSKADVIGLRLDKDDMVAFVAANGESPFEGTLGFVSADYVAIPKAMLADSRALKRWFKLSHAHAVTLKPKKTTR
jgi:TfoX/Sxy family transcriptional regulator of competence genes